MVAPRAAKSATFCRRRPRPVFATPGCTSPSNKDNWTSHSDSTASTVTTDRPLALAYASTWSPDGRRCRGGFLYLVDSDELESDEDLLSLPGLSFQVRSARVIAVARSRVRFDREAQSAEDERDRHSPRTRQKSCQWRVVAVSGVRSWLLGVVRAGPCRDCPRPAEPLWARAAHHEPFRVVPRRRGDRSSPAATGHSRVSRSTRAPSVRRSRGPPVRYRRRFAAAGRPGQMRST